MMLQFQKWLLVENTVSQLLKSNPDKTAVDQAQTEVRNTLKRLAWTHQIPDQQLYPLVKLFTFWIMEMQTTSKQITAQPGATIKHEEIWTRNMIETWVLRTFLRDTSDYLAALLTEQPNIARSKFNNPQYKLTHLKADSETWHEKIAAQNRQSADPGRKVEITGMPPGYHWVSLDRASCDKEADAMGHCGNSGYKQGDNIWSMRDSKGIPHLTFIVNSKILGESKGYANNKPEAKYHPHIIALLLGTDNGESIIEYIRGGGYKPEANFQINDLNKEAKEQLLKQKPQLNDYFMHLKILAGGNEKKWKKLIDDAFNFEFTRVDVNKNEVVVKEFGDITQLIEWLKDNTESKLDEIPNFDEMPDFDHNISLRDAIYHFENDADHKAEELMKQIITALKEQMPKSDDDEYNAEWAAQQNDDVENALRWSCDDGWRSGSESEAYKHVTNFFKREQDHHGHGFITDATYGGGWHITISLKDLETLYKTKDDYEDWHNSYQDLPNHISYHYDPPYNGYNDFDESAYNERLKEMLEEVLENINKLV